MRQTGFFLLILGVAAWLAADLYVKEQRHADGYYHHGTMEQDSDTEIIQWFGDGVLDYGVGEKRVIVNLKTSTCQVVNGTTKSYVEMAIPVDLASGVEESLAPLINLYKGKGEVAATDEKKTVMGKTCRGYKLGSWILYEGARYNETETMAWITTELDYDLKMLDRLQAVMMVLGNMDESYMQEAEKIKGLMLASDSIRYSEGQKVKSWTKVLELSDREPPEGTYHVPPEYEKKEKLTHPDLDF